VIRQDRKRPAGGGEKIWLVEIGSLKMGFPEKDLTPLPPSRSEQKPLIAAAEVSAPRPGLKSAFKNIYFLSGAGGWLPNNGQPPARLNTLYCRIILRIRLFIKSPT
jgi:hypothetical protein